MRQGMRGFDDAHPIRVRSIRFCLRRAAGFGQRLLLLLHSLEVLHPIRFPGLAAVPQRHERRLTDSLSGSPAGRSWLRIQPVSGNWLSCKANEPSRDDHAICAWTESDYYLIGVARIEVA